MGRSDKAVTMEVTRRDMVKYAVSTEQIQEEYLRGDEALPMFVSCLSREIVSIDELGPDGLPPASLLPELPLERVMTGGVKFTFHKTLRPDGTLVFRRTLSEITEQHCRNGPLIYRITCETEDGEPVLD